MMATANEAEGISAEIDGVKAKLYIAIQAVCSR